MSGLVFRAAARRASTITVTAPRQLPLGVVTDPKTSSRQVSLAVSFLTDAERLRAHLPPVFSLDEHQATGRFLAVVWENLADPIITGRDEIGHPMLYADIPESRSWANELHCTAGWMGFRFLDMSVADLRDPSSAPEAPFTDGTLMLKYLPRTGAWGQADCNR